LCVGVFTARPRPDPARASASIAIVGARPVKTEKTPQIAAPSVAIRTRLNRSARKAIGISRRRIGTVINATTVKIPSVDNRK
jgi:hypothetical protein